MCALKDLSLHSSLRQPAIDLIQTIIVSDASAFLSVIWNDHFHPSDKSIAPSSYCEDEWEEDILSILNVKEKDVSCWKEFMLQHNMISQVDGSWMCVPMLWFDVLSEIDPLSLPLSFSKAVLWALSRFSLIEPENNAETGLSLKNWLMTCTSEVSYLFGWKVPSGSDDGGDGTESRNSIRISTMCMPLVRTFKRLMVHFTVRMEQLLRKQWTWEPTMSNSLILLLVDPNDSTRQVGRLILEQVSGVRGLTGGLLFLCSAPSLPALLLGLHHALKLVQLDTISMNFSALHHLFFILCKLLKEGNSLAQTELQILSAVTDASKLSAQGGFLKPPLFESSPVGCDEHLTIVDSLLWKKFIFILSQVSWPAIVKCLDVGKTFNGRTVSQMTCIRLLEVIPVVFEKLPRNPGAMVEPLANLKWLHDLADWGKSSLDVLVRYWKQTLTFLLSLIRVFCRDKSASVISDIERLVLSEKISINEVSKQVALLSITLTDEVYEVKCTRVRSKRSPSEEFSSSRTLSSKDSGNLLTDGAEVDRLDSEVLMDRDQGHIIILSDDEEEIQIPSPCSWPSKSTFYDELVGANASGRRFHSDLEENDFGTPVGLMPSKACHPLEANHITSDLVTKKMSSEALGDHHRPMSQVNAESSDCRRKGESDKDCVASFFVQQDCPNLKTSTDITPNLKQTDLVSSNICTNVKTFSDESFSSTSEVQPNLNKPLQTTAKVIKQVVCDNDDDAWEFSFFKPPRPPHKPIMTKAIPSGPKRQVIQLTMPAENKSGFKRLENEVKRFNPPMFDDWYKPILQFDFFVHVGLNPRSGRECNNGSKLKTIPVCFQSPDEYIEIFRPLVLEELKAQLQNSSQETSSTEDTFFESLSVLSVERIDDFHVVRFVHDETDFTGSKGLVENDLVLLTKQPLLNSYGDAHAIGKVEKRERDSKRRFNVVAIRFYMQGCTRLNRVRKLLTERSKWYVYQIMSITPQLREFQALSAIKEIPLHPIILKPIDQPCCKNDSRTRTFRKLSQPMQQIIRSSYNASQLQAISASVGPFDAKDFELTLVQGPPGTGKTRTIVAIVSCLLAFFQFKDAKKLRSYDQVCSNSINTNQRISQATAIARAWQDAALAKQLNEDAEKINQCMGGTNRGRILICAQSNAAVDELVARLSSEGLYGNDGLMYKPYLVRVGNAKTVHPNSLPLLIDTLVENRLQDEKRKKDDGKLNETSPDSLVTIRSNLEKLVDCIRDYEARHANLSEGSSDLKKSVAGDDMDTMNLSGVELKEKLRVLYEKKKMMYKELANAQARERKATEETKALRHKHRTAILKEAEIIVTTLSGCGGDLYGVCSESVSGHKFSSSSESSLFDAVVIDEAAQALEPATLIPLQLLKSVGTKCIMVGDPKQLSATVISSVASKYMFQCSLFERLHKAGHPVIMLTEQYRMHPEICRFPSAHFYEGKLLNGDQMSAKATSFHQIRYLGPYVFFDIVDGQETHGKNAAAMSLCNECEADAAVELLRFFRKRHPSEFFSQRIGVITPYKCQLSLLRSRFSTVFGSSRVEKMEFNTVDGFQGREVDILLLSTVRADGYSSGTIRTGSNNLGFVADVRRMNVSLTRAKLSLWIFGNARTLQTNQDWAALVDDAKQRNLIVSGRKPYSSMFRSVGNMQGPGNFAERTGRSENIESFKTGIDYVNTRDVMKYSSKSKRKHTNTLPNLASNLDRAVSPAEKDSFKGSSYRDRDRCRAPLDKDDSSIAVQKSDNKALKVAKSGFDENRESMDKTSVGLTNLQTDDNGRSRSSTIGKMKNRNLNHLKTVHGEMCVKSVKHDAQERRMIVGTSSSDISHNQRDERGCPDQVEMPTDSITKRKQQREAVDALLSSALISSKKSESVLKSSVKRSISSTNTKDSSVRQQKPRKDQ